MITLDELQTSTAKVWESVCRTTSSSTLRKSGLCVRSGSRQTKIELFVLNAKHNVHKSNTAHQPEHTNSTVKHGGGYIIGQGMLFFSRDREDGVDGKTDRAKYRASFEENHCSLQKTWDWDRGLPCNKNDDHQPKAISTMESFKTKHIQELEWPSRSPDLNPIKKSRVLLTNALYQTSMSWSCFTRRNGQKFQSLN